MISNFHVGERAADMPSTSPSKIIKTNNQRYAASREDSLHQRSTRPFQTCSLNDRETLERVNIWETDQRRELSVVVSNWN